YDLVLRLSRSGASFAHIPRVLYRWNLGPKSLSRSPSLDAVRFEAAPHLSEATNRAVQEHLDVIGVAATAGGSERWPKLTFSISDQGKVTIIVCTKDQPRLLSRCVRSIERSTDYANYEILIVDNGSTTYAAKRTLSRLARKHRVVRIIQDESGFNFS